MDLDALVASFRTQIEQLKTTSEKVFLQRLLQMAELLTNDSTPVSVLQAASELVAALFSHDAVKKAMANTPRPAIIDALFACLKNNKNMPNVHRHIFTAIGNLTDIKDASQNWLVSEYDAINVIIGLSKQSLMPLPEVLAQAFYALQKIAMGNEANIRTLFDDHQVYELGLTALTTHTTHVPLQTQACALLRRLSFLTENATVLMAKTSKHLFQSMRSFASEPQIQEHCSAFCGNLAINANIRKVLIRAPFVVHETVLLAMRNHPQNTAIQAEGCFALSNLARHDENDKLLTGEPYLAHKAVLSAMRDHPHNAAVQENGCDALWNFGQTCSTMLVAYPYLAHQAILCAMRSHPQVAFVQERACGALSTLAANHEIQKVLIQFDAHISVMATLRAHPQNESVQLYAIWALANMSFELSNRPVLQHADVLDVCEKVQRNFPDTNHIANKLNILQRHLN